MEYHPFAEPWPLMTGQQFDELVADIREHGLRQAITIYEKKILDGRNRFRACLKAGVAPYYEAAPVKNDYEALMLSASLNKHRRHMSEDQLAFVAEELSKFTHGGERKFGVKISNGILKREMTLKDAADAVGVSLQHVQRARAIKNHAPEMIPDVKDGKVSMSIAAQRAFEKARAKKGPRRKTAAEVAAINAAKAANHTPRTLYRRDVDPEFVGDEIAFVAEYGNVWSQTSEERSTARLAAWVIAMRHLARKLRDHQLPPITPTVLSWLRKPKPQDVGDLKRAVTELSLALATARDLLKAAQSAIVENEREREKE